MATEISGNEGVFGLSGNETGIITSKVSFSYSVEETELVDYDNEVVDVALSKEKVDITIEGKIKADSSFGGSLGAALTLVSSMPQYLEGSVSAGTSYINGIDVDREAGDYNSISVKAVYRPSLVTV